MVQEEDCGDEDPQEHFEQFPLTKNYFEALRQIPWSQILSRLGKQLKGSSRPYLKCHVHNESSSSLRLLDNGRWHCYGCDRDGDTFDLVAGHVTPRRGERAVRATIRFFRKKFGIDPKDFV